MPKKHKLPEEALEYFRRVGRAGGKLGAKKRNENLTPEQRSAIAKHAVTVREQKRAARKAKG